MTNPRFPTSDLLTLALEANPAMALALQDGRIIAVNSAALRLLGYRGGELVGQPFVEFVHPEHRESAARRLAAVAQGSGDNNRHQFPLVCKSGTTLWFEAAQFRVTHENASAVMLSGLDITQTASRTQRERLLIDQTPLAVIEWDLDFRVTRWNQAAERIFGYGTAEMLGRHAEEIIPEEFRPHVQEVWQQLIHNAGGFHSFNENVAKDGARLICEWYNTPLLDEAGAVIGVASLVQDVTDRHRAEQALRRQSSLYKALSETNQIIIRLQRADELFDRVCRIAVEHGGFRLAWVGEVDPDSGWVHPVAQSGSGTGYLAQLRVSVDPKRAEGQGPTGHAIREGRPFIVDDFLARLNTGPWHAAAEAARLRASAAFPIRRDGVPMAALNVYADQVGYFTPDLVALLEEMADDISFALDNFERERQRKLAQAERDRLVTILEATPDFVGIADPNGNVLYRNAGAYRLLGIEPNPGDPVGSVYDNQTDEAAAAVRHKIFPTAASKGVWRGENVIVNARGEEIPVSQIVIAHRNSDGQLTHFSTIARDIRDIKQAEARIEHLAFYDGLTGLPNRRLLRDRLQQDFNRLRRQHAVGAVLYLDLDRFKTTNDSLGPSGGDALLRQVAQRLLAEMRMEDTLARTGSDEFVVVLSDIGADRNEAAGNTQTIAEAMRQALAPPLNILGHEIHVSVSIGVAFFPNDNPDIDTVLRHADTAMNRAKTAGGDTIRFFAPDMQVAAEHRMQLEKDLRRALERDELVLYFQPQVDMGNGAIIGAEVLLRWIHRDRGLVSPADFIPIAEETGVILPIGAWVLEQALEQVRQWIDGGLCSYTGSLAVNVSPRQFRQPDFVQQVATLVEKGDIPPGCLKLEITEGVVIDDIADTVKKMHALKNIGVGVAIDDFGTGYSSLAYLKRLPLDVLKIDKSFVEDIPHDPNDAAIVETIVAMARLLGLQVIAEGVESEAQLRFLQDKGCNAYQGFYCSPPLPGEEFGHFLAGQHTLS
jgi:diguanylate cyclase (GGDEF)-like protein/PAS domain S-box-containing protein